MVRAFSSARPALLIDKKGSKSAMPLKHDSSEDVALSLTLSIVTSSPEPLLLLDNKLCVVAASTSFCAAFGANPTQLAGHALFAVGDGEWENPQLLALLSEARSGDDTSDVCEMDFQRPQQPVQHLIVQARQLAYLDLEQMRILVTVLDVTEARADAALKKAAAQRSQVLLQEVRHRVANSLQIIASVLLRNARETKSEETRKHLQNAHNRVMSVAALERLLSTSGNGNIEVHTYFTLLCENISTSMISEVDQISLVVDGGSGVVEAKVAVSLGLIVTELVINALKYAFPDGRAGKITVDYDFHGPNWVLCVQDDGVGMPLTEPARTGLGTSIVAALAAQLNASVEMSAEHPGTQVSIKHAQVAMVRAEAAGDSVTAEHSATMAINR